MPYDIQANPVGRGYFVITQGTGERHSGHPLSKENAEGQMRALYAHLADTEKMHEARGRSHYSIIGHEKKSDFK
jgi:hypothetical protein